jgi:hypothetical protein
MNRNGQSPVSRSRNREHRLACGECIRETKHIVLHSVDKEKEIFDNEHRYIEQYQIVQCRGCETVSFRLSRINTHESVWDEDLNQEIVQERFELFPSRVAGRHKLRQSKFLPLPIAKIYDETHAALCGKQTILAGIGIRVLIEAVCVEKGAEGKYLGSKIDNLVRIGILTEAGAKILHNLRDLGNTAAHEAKPLSEETLGIAMDVVEHLLNEVYILPKVADSLPNRKLRP